MGYRIPERTLPPSLVLVRRLFLSVKSISGNKVNLFIIFILVPNVTLHVLIDSFPLLCGLGRRYRAHASASTRARLSYLSPQETRGKIYKSQFSNLCSRQYNS